jgi:hypothetical protein
MKIVCDKVPELNPWGVLMGDDSAQPAVASAATSRIRSIKGKHKEQKAAKEEKLVNQ